MNGGVHLVNRHTHRMRRRAQELLDQQMMGKLDSLWNVGAKRCGSGIADGNPQDSRVTLTGPQATRKDMKKTRFAGTVRANQRDGRPGGYDPINGRQATRYRHARE